MPQLMSLEGPQLSRVDQIRGQLYAAAPKRWLRGTGMGDTFLTPYVSPFVSHPVVFALGIVAGFWLAGSKAGQKLLKR